MARNSKLQKDGGQLKRSAPTILQAIVADVLEATTLSFEQWWAQTQAPLTPLAIPTSDGREYRVTQTGVDAAHELTKQTWDARTDYRQTIERKAFDRLSFMAIGDTVLDARNHLPKQTEAGEDTFDEEAFYSALAKDYAANVERLANKVRPDVDRHIPCHLFHSDQNVPAFSIGVIEFLPRSDWFDRFVKDPRERAHIKKVEQLTMSFEALEQKAHTPGRTQDVFNAWWLLSSLSSYSWVATIKMKGHEHSQSHHKASIFVGLAIDALGLRFQVEDSRHFTKAGRQHLYSEDRLATSVNGTFLRGSSVEMPGLGAKPGALAEKMTAERPFLNAAGLILDAFVKGRQSGHAPHLVERWANALYWVGEARREASDFLAVVKYGCAADCLSGAGGDAKKMAAFADAALNPKGEDTPAGALTVDEAVTAVYREGRNKLAHGETSGLFEELTRTRAIGDALLVGLFDVVTMELAKIIAANDRILLLKKEEQAYRALEARMRDRPPT